MASAAVQQPTGHTTSFEPLTTTTDAAPKDKQHNVHTTLNYYKDPGDGAGPPPPYVRQPETYERPTYPLPVTVTDVRGHEAEYNLDNKGFQFYKHASVEKDFKDDDHIKAVYYPEVEQLLKDA